MGDENGGIIFIGNQGEDHDRVLRDEPDASADLPNERLHPTGTDASPRERGNGNIWDTDAHEQDWIRACKESPDNRMEASSNFQFSGPFNEMVVMGVLATRLSGLYGLHRELKWDGEEMRFTNISPNDTIKIVTVDEYAVNRWRSQVRPPLRRVQRVGDG